MRLPLCAALLLAGAVAPMASAETLRIDGARSEAAFEVRAVWVKRIDGRFAHVEGVIEADRERGSYVVDVRIAGGSVLMDRKSHEEWARSPEFFDTERHPWIQFRTAELPAARLSEGGALRGTLTLRGISREVEFEILPSECGRPGLDCPVRARGELERTDFGMDARRMFVSDKVRLSFNIRVHPETPVDPL
jgi:polyisoprenoid-binding protein YceI